MNASKETKNQSSQSSSIDATGIKARKVKTSSIPFQSVCKSGNIMKMIMTILGSAAIWILSSDFIQLRVAIFTTAALILISSKKVNAQKKQRNKSILMLQNCNHRRHHPNILPPYWNKSLSHSDPSLPLISNMTLRKFLSHPDGFHLAMAPAFFGFYAYFGALIAMNEMRISFEDPKSLQSTLFPAGSQDFSECVSGCSPSNNVLLQSVAGSSAGAIAAVVLASGADPRNAAAFVSSMKLRDLADPLGFGGILRGNYVEKSLSEFLNGRRLETSNVPVAVTAYDLISRKEKIFTQGCSARAARASATFPGLFQPVLWRDNISNTKCSFSWLIDGGVEDPFGLLGLSVLLPQCKKKRVVNMIIGGFGGAPPGPSQMPPDLDAHEVISIAIKNTPICGPMKMHNGPKAIRSAMLAVTDVLDAPLYNGTEPGHYILPIDASAFDCDD